MEKLDRETSELTRMKAQLAQILAQKQELQAAPAALPDTDHIDRAIQAAFVIHGLFALFSSNTNFNNFIHSQLILDRL